MKESIRKTVVITGASAGVGRALAREFAKRGCRIGLLARGEDGLNATKREVEEIGGQAISIPVDVADADRVDEAIATIESRFGPLDIWINNAMLSVFSSIKDMTPEEFKRVTEVTYLGAVYGTQAALKRMLPRNHGVIVQVGSSLAYRAIPLQSAYCAAKHALQAFHESLRTELLHDRSNVRVTMVQLPALNTPQFDWSRNKLPNRLQPIPPIFQPELAAQAILWAIEHPEREWKVGFSTFLVLLLNKLIPGAIDHYLARTGFSQQQATEMKDPMAPDNLWKPVVGGHRTHGRFNAIAKNHSLHWWINTHKLPSALFLMGLSGLVVAGLKKSKRVKTRFWKR